ncbi:hypothetical protein VNO80_13565 [Phaseolus coccineus]|uniref:DDT domain-containing protein n=1 Tax=Phaseolus coccineus TaxID=3886 RepID=A0AAN9N6H2_PHACN
MDNRLFSTQNKNFEEGLASGEKLKRSNSCPVQIGTNGKSCHQCRQKKEDFAATCKNLKKGKPCPIKYCHKCLLTRYGENAEEVGHLADWECPKCRGFCNCSLCQKKRGEQPTGPLYRNAKESGFKSVAEMLAVKKASEASGLNKVNDTGELEVHLSGESGKENCTNTNDATKVCNKEYDEGDNVDAVFQGESKTIEEEFLLPPGIELKEIFGIELPPKDVGNALQLLEFCKVFGKALDIKEGEAEAMLEELVCKQNMHGQNSLVNEFHFRVLALILNNSGNESSSLPTRDESNSWLKYLEDLIIKSYHILNDFPLDWFQEGISGYHNLDLSKKLKLMTFLCDEALNTEKLRSYIYEENSKHVKEVKEAKHKVAATKEKVKFLEQKLRSEKAKVVPSTVSPFSMEEHEALLSKIKIEVDEAQTEMLELKCTTQKAKLGCDALRIKPEFVDNNGKTFWNFRGCSSEGAVLLQEIKIQDEIAKTPEENWYVYGCDKKEEVDKYISTRAKRPNRHKVLVEIFEGNTGFFHDFVALKKWDIWLIGHVQSVEAFAIVTYAKRGEQPTSPLYRNAKESSFKSVAKMLVVKKASEASGLNKELEVHLSGESGKENCTNTNDVTKVCNKEYDEGDNVDAVFQGESKTIEEEILLPPGIELKEIFGIELPPKDVGNALQLLEFCKVFGNVWFHVNNLS